MTFCRVDIHNVSTQIYKITSLHTSKLYHETLSNTEKKGHLPSHETRLKYTTWRTTEETFTRAEYWYFLWIKKVLTIIPSVTCTFVFWAPTSGGYFDKSRDIYLNLVYVYIN